MTFQGDTVIGKPTLTQVEIYVAEKGLYVEPQFAYDYWEKKNWLTCKGVPVKTLEAAIDVINGIVIYKEFGSKRNIAQNKRRKVSIKEARKKALSVALEDTKTSYVEYEEQLKHPFWKAFRKFVFAVRGKKCEVCGATDNLQVHHHKYRNVMAWEYTCNEVMVVCGSCHKKIHGIE